MTDTNVGKWGPWYRGVTETKPYGDPRTYGWAEEWLKGRPVQDWGCGYGWFRTQHDGPYHGIDGTFTPFCDQVVDLVHFRSQGWDILLKHVLEHNHQWRAILDNAVASFEDRLLILIFTPMQDETRVLDENVAGLGVPDIGFKLSDITDRLVGCQWTVEEWGAYSGYNNLETVFKVERP